MTGHPHTERANLIGIGWMLLTGLLFVGVNGTVRHVGPDLPAVQGAFIRFVIGLLILMPVLLRGLRGGFPARLWPLFVGRGALHCFAVGLWFFAMSNITVAEVTAIGFLNPIIVTLGAAMILGETLSWRRLLAILIALLGAVIVLRPGVRDLGAGHLAQLGAALCFAASYMVAKQLSVEVTAGAVVAMMSLTVTIGLAVPAALVWQPPTAVQIGWLALTAVFATAGHYTMTRAFASAPLTVTQPVVFCNWYGQACWGRWSFTNRLIRGFWSGVVS